VLPRSHHRSPSPTLPSGKRATEIFEFHHLALADKRSIHLLSLCNMQRALGPGAILLGRYRVESVLDRGGMGIVLAVTHLRLGDDLALKLLPPEGDSDRTSSLGHARSSVRGSLARRARRARQRHWHDDRRSSLHRDGGLPWRRPVSRARAEGSGSPGHDGRRHPPGLRGPRRGTPPRRRDHRDHEGHSERRT